MASALLHIKDAYYFEIPPYLWPSHRQRIEDFPEVWVRLDADYQLWEARRIHEGLVKEFSGASIPDWETVRGEYLEWKHDHANFAKPLDVYLEEQAAAIRAAHAEWAARPEHVNRSLGDYIRAEHPAAGWFARLTLHEDWNAKWTTVKSQAEDIHGYAQSHEWSMQKVDAYNQRLSGKILIPQPFGTLRNLYEAEAGWCISKFLVIELVVALLLVAIFSWLGRKLASGGPPRGRLWNLLEVFLFYFRDEVVRPAMGPDHDAQHGHGEGPAGHEHGHGHGRDAAHEEEEIVGYRNEYADADRFLPLFWTMFFFILGCNLMGILPWLGAPTGSFSVTLGLAAVTLGTGLICGIRRHGMAGIWTSLLPTMDIPIWVGIFVKPMLLLIEWLGFLIRHGVLGIRLLANMVAGHLVLGAIMGLAFGAAAAHGFVDAPAWKWWLTATIAILGSSAFTALELFVCFLQAYVFTFLSALFVSSLIHKH